MLELLRIQIRQAASVRLALSLGILLAGCSSETGPNSPDEPDGQRASRQSAPTEETEQSASLDNTAARDPRPDDWFEDVTERTGVRFAYRTGRDGGHYTILETVGGGVAMFDYDGDGDLDLYFPGGGAISAEAMEIRGAPPKLFRNDGDWKFTDVTEAVGLSEATDYSHECAVADFNRDGFPDLFVTCYGRSRLYLNREGERFEDVTAPMGLVIDGWSTAAAWADVDADGWPDLYVAGYLDWKPQPGEFCGDAGRMIRDVCPPQNYPPAPDRLFRSVGGERFEEITDRAGLKSTGRGLGVVAADLNGDGWIDFYVANDAGANHLYLGAPELRFREAAVPAGVAYNEYGAPEGSMGADAGDFDGDGHADLFTTNFELEDNSLYRRHGVEYFTHATVAAGLGGVGRPLVGFGTGFVDFDSDGWLDLFVINGNVFYQLGQRPYHQPAILLRNEEGRRFADVTGRGGPYFSLPHAGRGTAVGDLDNDGAPDLVVVHQDAPVSLLRNRLVPKNWVRVQLRGTESEPAAVGAVVSMDYQGRKLVRPMRSGAGYLSQFDPRLLFPLDEANEETLPAATVQWLGGKRETFRDLKARQTNDLVEGQGESVEGKGDVERH